MEPIEQDPFAYQTPRRRGATRRLFWDRNNIIPGEQMQRQIQDYETNMQVSQAILFTISFIFNTELFLVMRANFTAGG